MWDQLNIESEKVKRFAWLFLSCLLVTHAIAILLVGIRLQNLIFILAIVSAFFIVAQVGRIKIWLTAVSAGVVFGLLPVAQTAGSAEKFSLWAWKAIMHTALGTSLALLLMAEIPFRGDVSLALAFDTVLMVVALVSMTYIEVETKWYPTIVRVIAIAIIAIILIEVALGIAFPETSKSDRWWKLLEFIKEHKIAVALLIGVPLLLWRKIQIPAIPWGKLIGILIILGILAMIFQPTRDWLLDKWNRPEVKTAVTGTETTKSVQVTALGPFKICELEANTAYTFVKSSTSEGDTYRTKSPRDNSVEAHKITGMFYSTPEDLPYPDAKYAFGILVNGVPPGRIAKTDPLGCVQGSFNTRIGGTRILVGDPWIGIVFRK